MAPPTAPIPADNGIQEAPRIIIAPHVVAGDGSEWAYDGTGYTRIVDPWAIEQHIAPVNTLEKLGDIESWVAYVERFAGLDGYAPLLTWGPGGLRAMLDYHRGDQSSGRCQWLAEHPFVKTEQWYRWAKIADGHGKSQQEVLEHFEDNAPDIKAPAAGEIAAILRTLRATVNVTAETKLGEDGSSEIQYAKTAGVRAKDDLTLPSSILISIPLLRGHTATTADGKLAPVFYDLEVKLRVSVGANDRPQFRLTIPRAEQAFEAVYADRVVRAKELLGDRGAELLRAAS